jgi:geranylgeranyl diphosphate synthase type II
MGAIAAGASDRQFDAACQFAAGIGLAFQIRDDMLDVIGSEEELGKRVGTDETKNTFVRLYGLEHCEHLVKQYTEYALSALDVFADTNFLRGLSLQLTQRMK